MNKRLLLTVLSLFCINTLLYAQGEYVVRFDSLLVAQRNYPRQDERKLDMMNKLTFGYHSRDHFWGLKMGEKAIALAHQLNKPLLLADAYFSQGTNFMANSRYQEALNLYHKAMEIYKIQNSKSGMGFCYNYIGEVYRRQGDLNKALSLYKTGFRLFEESKNEMGKAEIYNVMGCVNLGEDNYPKAIENFQNAIRINERIKDYEGLGQNLNNLGLVYFYADNDSSALTCFKKAVMYNEKAGNKMWVAMHLDNEADVYRKLKKYPQAIALYQQAMDINQSIGNRSSIAINCNNMGVAYKELKDWPKALSFFEKAKQISAEIGDKNRYITSLYHIGTVYLDAPDELLIQNQVKPSQRFNTAIATFNQCITLSVETRSLSMKIACLAAISDVYERMNNHQNAIQFYKTYVALRDSVEGNKVKRQITRKEVEFEYEKKEAELKYQQQLALDKVEQQKLLLLASLITFVLVGTIYLLWQRQKRLKQEKLNSMNFTKQLLETTEEERRRIASDLHDSISHELLNLKTSLNQDIQVITGKIDTIINDIRGISRNLHPVMFDTFGLEPVIEQLVERLGNQHNFMVSTEIDYSGFMSSAHELQMYRIIQEALSNIIKYAKAHAAQITLQETDDNLRLEIRDNGKGFDVQKALNSGKAFGLHNIIERSRVIGGKATVVSSSQGTCISIDIPRNK